MTPMSLETTQERKEKGGERGEKKKRTPGTHNFYIAYFEGQKSACDTPLRHLNRAVPFSKIQVDISITADSTVSAFWASTLQY